MHQPNGVTFWKIPPLELLLEEERKRHKHNSAEISFTKKSQGSQPQEFIEMNKSQRSQQGTVITPETLQNTDKIQATEKSQEPQTQTMHDTDSLSLENETLFDGTLKLNEINENVMPLKTEENASEAITAITKIREFEFMNIDNNHLEAHSNDNRLPRTEPAEDVNEDTQESKSPSDFIQVESIEETQKKIANNLPKKISNTTQNAKLEELLRTNTDKNRCENENDKPPRKAKDRETIEEIDRQNLMHLSLYDRKNSHTLWKENEKKSFESSETVRVTNVKIHTQLPEDERRQLKLEKDTGTPKFYLEPTTYTLEGAVCCDATACIWRRDCSYFI